MCGYSRFKRNDEIYYLYLGYYGGELKIGNIEYVDNSGLKPRAEMKKRLMEMEKEEMAEMILGFVENSEES